MIAPDILSHKAPLHFRFGGNMEECSAILSVLEEVRDEILKRFIEEWYAINLNVSILQNLIVILRISFSKNLCDEIKEETSSEQRKQLEDLNALIDAAAEKWG